MGNFEKLSVLVIGVIIVMILVVAIHTWTSDPAAPGAPGEGAELTMVGPSVEPATGLDPVVPGDDPVVVAGPVTEDPDYWDPDYTPTPDADTAQGPEAPATDAEEPAMEPVAEPEAPRETAQRTVTVKPGDTLGHISQRAYGTTRHWKKIAEVNNIDPRTIRPNMVLIIPDVGGSTSGALPAVAAGGARPVKGSAYQVRSGDTIENIAKAAFGTVERWPDIWFENMERISDPDELEAGIEIQIPN